MFKTALAKIVSGLLLGAGFTIAAIAIVQGYDKFLSGKSSRARYQEYSPKAGLVIREHRPQQAAGNAAFVGTISNNGKDTWQRVELIVELLGKDGTFLDKCSDSLDGRIGPGQVRHFKVSCGGCRDATVPQYDHYTIAIIDASYVFEKSGTPAR